MSIRSGFTLVEMIVVVGVMMIVLAMLLPGIAVMQRKTDLYATSNVLQNVHAIQFRNARQFGSAGLVYGYTLMYTSDIPNPGGSRSAGYLKPWIIGAPSLYHHAGNNDLKADIGNRMFWTVVGTTSVIEFVDLFRPAGKVVIDGTTHSLPIGETRYLHVGFSPRHGFVQAVLSLDSDPEPALSLDAISDPAAPHQAVMLDLWSVRSKATRLRARIARTGIIHVDANL